MNILDNYQAILLDMNSTFMFGEDRFGTEEDFYKTYLNIGGNELSPDQVNKAIRTCYDNMLRDYEDPQRYENFPGLHEGLKQYAGVDEQHIDHLSSVFAQHEIGTVSGRHADLLNSWSQTHRLGVVSNIWAEKSPWLAEFRRAGISDIWQTVVFSSDNRCIKPSLTMFRQALDEIGIPAVDVLFIGDSIRVDMQPAKALGMDSLWLTDTADEHPMADYVTRSLLDIESLELY